MTTDATFNELFEALVSAGKLTTTVWPDELGAPEDLGLRVVGQDILLRPGAELLSVDDIGGALSQRAASWLASLEVHRVIGSTNDRLMGIADSGSVDGHVCLAELQTKGRGRRGRAWRSPFAGNLALSLGVMVDKALHELGGLSLVIGLGALDCLRSLGVEDVALKWPNDILLSGRKLGGILVELQNRPAGRAQAVIGIGLNVDVPAGVQQTIDQPLADLHGAGYSISRNLLAGRLVSCLVDYVKEFDAAGFAPMRDAFNEQHLFHQRACAITQGETVVTGRVVGVTEVGEILLETDSGTVAFGAGEVSLRQQE